MSLMKLALALTLLSVALAAGTHTLTCTLARSMPLRYPLAGGRAFVIDFNTTTGQANYAYYLSRGPVVCPRCRHGKVADDPYGVSTLSSHDYVGTGLDRGALVPFADLGNITSVITNMVPMTGYFNSPVWRDSEEYIRQVHAGRLIVKGCEYDGGRRTTPSGKTLYVPTGCYYVVFMNDTMPVDVPSGVVMEATYLDMNDLRAHYRLPHWLTCVRSVDSVAPRVQHDSNLLTVRTVRMLPVVAVLAHLACLLVMRRR